MEALANLPFANGFHGNGAAQQPWMNGEGPLNGFHANHVSECHAMESGDCPSMIAAPVFKPANYIMSSTDDRNVNDSQTQCQKPYMENGCNRPEPFNCLKFKETPMKCMNFMSHLI